jgi:N-acetylglucosamine-6-phosphate deacetylase
MRLGVGHCLVDGELVAGDVSVAGGVIEAVGLSPAGSGMAVAGFVDLQVNGFAGLDFLTAAPDDYREVGYPLAATGVVAYQPTLITAPAEATEGALHSIAQAAAGGRPGPRILGAHLEGPYLSPRRAGAHPVEFLREPDPAEIDRFLRTGPVSHFTLAPELPGAVEAVSQLRAAGVVVALGHTDATATEAAAGFDAGATAVTHLFNAMRPFSHRDPGIVGAALSRAGVGLGVIADGVHLAPEALMLAWRAGPDRTFVVTDAIAAAGRMVEGTWRIGTVEVVVQGWEARRRDGTLAGSVATMDESFRYLMSLGLSAAEAERLTSLNAARLVGLEAGLGPGRVADVVVLDDGLAVERTLVAGVEVYPK